MHYDDRDKGRGMNLVIEKYLTYLSTQKGSKNTVTAYGIDLSRLFAYLETKGIYDPEGVTFTDLNSYILSLEKNNASMATVSRNVSSIRSFFMWLFTERMIKSNPASNLKAPKIVRKKPEILTKEEMLMLLDAPDRTSAKGLRDAAILELLYATGIRVSELVNLRCADVNPATRFLKIKDDRHERMIPFGVPAQKALHDYLSDGRDKLIKNADEDILFVNAKGEQMTRQGVWKIIKTYGKNVGITTELTPHIIRHTFAAHMVMNGADLKTLQEILGHEDITATQIYTGFADNRLDYVYEKAHPRR